MPDIFDFLSTRLEIQEPVQIGKLPDLTPVPVLPTVPADYRTTVNSKQNSNNPTALLDFLSKRLETLPDNRPAYEYTRQQEKRYSNPNVQYSPYTTLGTDTEDIYGRKQGEGEQLFNGLVKFGANAIGTFASSFLTIPRQLDSVRSGNFQEFFNDDGMFEGVQSWLTEMEDKFPNYYTEWEREHPYQSGFNIFKPVGLANFWGDKILKNAGFTIGGLASGLVVDAAIEFGTAGTATPAAFLSLANHLNQAKNRMFTAFRGLNKAAYLNKMDDVIGATKVSNLYAGIKTSQIPIKKGFQYAATTYFSAQGESFIEGYHTYIDTKKQLLEEAINRGETDSETLNDIEKRAQDAGRLTTAFNMPVLMASNLLQFPTLLYGKRAFVNPFIKIAFAKEGLQAVNNYSFKKDLKRWALESFKDSSVEGLEEATQYFISNSLHDYYADRLNPNIKRELLDFVISNAPNVLNDPRLYEEAFLGAISGFMMGAPVSIPNLTRGKSRYDNLTTNLNNVYSRFNQSAKNFTNNIEFNGLQNPDQQQVAAHKTIYSTVSDSLKFGTYESFLDSLEDLKTIDLNSYNQTFQSNFQSENEKLAHIQSLIQESHEIKKDIDSVNRFYPNNPYVSSFLARKVKDAFSDKTETEINNIQQNLFEEFKEVVGYNQSLQRITKGKILTAEQNLKNLGIKNESIEYLANISKSPKGLFQYSRWKKTQIDDLRKNQDYYETLVKEGTNESLKPKEELKNISQRLKNSEDFYIRLEKLYQKLKENPKDQQLQLQVLAEVLFEETNEEQRERFQEEKIKQAQDLENQSQQQAKLVEEEQDFNKEDSKTAEKILEVNQEAEHTKIQTIEPIPQPRLRKNSWMNKYEEGSVLTQNGQSFIIQSKTEDGILVKGEDGTIYTVTNEKGKLKFASSLGEMGIKSEAPSLPIETLPEEPRVSPEIPEISLSKEVEEIFEGELQYTLGTEEFTWEQMFDQPDSMWVLKSAGLGSSFVYSKEEDQVFRRDFNDLTKVNKKFTKEDKQPNYIKGNFVQLLRPDEQEIKLQPEQIITDMDIQIKSFLGKDYSEDYAKTLSESIQKGKIELIC